MSKEIKKVCFLSQYGPKKLGSNEFSPEMDVCDQRSPIFNVEQAIQQFTITEEIQDELDAEELEDFDNDVYPYEDITDYGKDILIAQQKEVAAAAKRLVKASKSNRAS